MEHFYFRERDGLKLLMCEPMEKIGFTAAFSTRLGGVSPLPANALSLGNFRQDERVNVVENRRRFQEALGVSAWKLATAHQIHSAEVRRVDAGAEPVECDALVANLPRTLLGVQTADCLPVLIADERSGACAAVHAGWRGTREGIVARTVQRLQQEFGSRPADLHAALGPAISAAVFEVGPEVLDAFRETYPYAEELFSDLQPSGKGHLNINQANLRQLTDAGLDPGRLYDSGLCTWLRNDLFFSYRREHGAQAPIGRLMGVIGRNSG